MFEISGVNCTIFTEGHLKHGFLSLNLTYLIPLREDVKIMPTLATLIRL